MPLDPHLSPFLQPRDLPQRFPNRRNESPLEREGSIDDFWATHFGNGERLGLVEVFREAALEKGVWDEQDEEAETLWFS